jgi:hypothetical protein
MLLLLVNTLLQAEPRESYIFLNKISQIERTLIAFSNHHFLYRMFPHKSIYKHKRDSNFNQYKAMMRQIAIDLKGGENRQLLTHMIDAKSSMQDILSGEMLSESHQRLLDIIQAFEKQVAHVSNAKKVALSPAQRVLYALVQMQVSLEEIFQAYLMGENHKTKGETIQVRMETHIKYFENNIQICSQYPYWSVKERGKGDRIKLAWTVLKKNLHQPGLAIITGLGSQHIISMIESLREIHESDQ